ncbi:MAG: hypothetical protein F2761_00445 [Actinobacteria bacterium]|uniref:Unannotated protein n=1 Tax=freshwater metagenome TaxID=449393 RepID=A0A6J6ZHB1_9ZZZZ|nr:hypothetical protein [Actinomycetota bacterium]MSX57275.1 hypothetical protein [Actinomycetota bacterium]
MRKLAAVGVTIIIASGVLTAAPATAAPISNGVTCTKSGASTTVSGRKYKCAKNPLSTSTKLTWLSNDCLLSANGYIKAKNSSAAISANYTAQIPVIDLGIANEITNKAEIQVKLDESNIRLTAAQAKLAAAKSDADKKILTTALGSWTSAVRAYTSKINAITATIRKLEASKAVAASKPIELASSIADSKSTALLICTKGL